MPRIVINKNPSASAAYGGKRSKQSFVALTDQYRSTLPRLAEIAATPPGAGTPSAVLEGEEAALLLIHERLITQAAGQKAYTLTDIRHKLELWRLEVIGVEGEPESVTDALVVSVIGDVKRLAKRQSKSSYKLLRDRL